MKTALEIHRATEDHDVRCDAGHRVRTTYAIFHNANRGGEGGEIVLCASHLVELAKRINTRIARDRLAG